MRAKIGMDQPYVYEIRVDRHLTNRWLDWFEGLAIHDDSNGETKLRGLFSDQSALLGVLNKIQALNLTFISVNRAPMKNEN